ncbi:MAG TPA: glycosyltransferase [Methylothermaceae bacterium]|nr:glycosyltransferase [Methylothermaceae bacterium]
MASETQLRYLCSWWRISSVGLQSLSNRISTGYAASINPRSYTTFDHNSELIATLEKYTHFYLYHIPQRALNHKTPIQTLQNWYEKNPESFKLPVNNLTGLDRYSPPFRPLSEKELAIEIMRVNASGVNILFVGLGCPKQEYWMAQQKGRIHAVMLGVGAAFDFLAGVKPHAPQWMQVIGLEWMFRLLCEPRRLWRRYLILNPRFLLYVFFQLTSTYTQP